MLRSLLGRCFPCGTKTLTWVTVLVALPFSGNCDHSRSCGGNDFATDRPVLGPRLPGVDEPRT